MLLASREIVISLGNILEEREEWVKGKNHGSDGKHCASGRSASFAGD